MGSPIPIVKRNTIDVTLNAGSFTRKINTPERLMLGTKVMLDFFSTGELLPFFVQALGFEGSAFVAHIVPADE